ncbi:hypothetical protein DOY81_001397 [Sarcophaga bullata]|nr:hypothetical protein DOY81_001397 [Sarcophaga bullata]
MPTSVKVREEEKKTTIPSYFLMKKFSSKVLTISRVKCKQTAEKDQLNKCGINLIKVLCSQINETVNVSTSQITRGGGVTLKNDPFTHTHSKKKEKDTPEYLSKWPKTIKK